MKSKSIGNLEDLKQLAYTLSQQLETPQVVLLKGELAVGKTQLVQFMIEALKGDPNMVSSPTFSLINNYTLKEFDPIYHIDLYRLKSNEELNELGFWDLFYHKALIFIEWPERVENKLPALWNKLWIEGCFFKNKRVFQWKQDSH